MNLFQNQSVIIHDIKDIDNLIEQLLVLPTEEIEKLEFLLDKTPEFIIQFRGERYDDGYLPYEMLKGITEIQTKIDNYFESFINSNLKDHNGKPLDIKLKPERIKVKFEKGCVIADIITALPKEAVTAFLSSINGTQITFSTFFFILAFYSNKSYQKFLDNEKEKLQIKLKSNENQEQVNLQKQTLELALKAIETLQQNKDMEKAKNTIPQSLLKHAKNDESIEFKTSIEQTKFSNKNIADFEVIDDADEKYITIEEIFNIKTISEHKVSPQIEIYNSNYQKIKAQTKLSEDEIVKLAKALKEHYGLKFKIKALTKNNQIISAEVYEIMSIAE